MDIPSKILAYWVPSIVVILISLNLHYSEFSNYVNTNPYQCEIIGGEKISGGYKTNGKMYLIAKDIKLIKYLVLRLLQKITIYTITNLVLY